MFFALCVALGRHREIHLISEMQRTFETLWSISLFWQTKNLLAERSQDFARLTLETLALLFLVYISPYFQASTVFPLHRNTAFLFLGYIISSHSFLCLFISEFFWIPFSSLLLKFSFPLLLSLLHCLKPTQLLDYSNLRIH